MEVNITITKPYLGRTAVLADVPAQVIIASLPQMTVPLHRHIFEEAMSRAHLRHEPKRLRFIEDKLTLAGYKLTITPKGPLVHLLDRGINTHQLAPWLGTGKHSSKTMWATGKNPHELMKTPRGYRHSAMHPGYPGRHFMPAALQASLPEMQRILDRNTETFLAKVENK